MDKSQGHPLLLVPAVNGEITAINNETGDLVWQTTVPLQKDQQAQLIATPVIVRNKLIIVYQTLANGRRNAHKLAVFDLDRKKWDDTFPVLTLTAKKPSWDGKSLVIFNPPTAYSHSPVKHVDMPASNWGYLYVAFGNAGDEQPFHGWLFEIDMDAWQEEGTKQAINNVLLTTPETDCPVNVSFGTQEMICGGGIWTPAGFPAHPKGDNIELMLATGNGQLDLAHQDYANTVMRLNPGLEFDPECDARLCRNFNPKQPDSACLASCKNLFVPRLLDNNKPIKPASGDCDNKTFNECLAWMDYDLGGSSPTKVLTKNGRSVVVQPGKEGAVYLFDVEHFGTLYDRLQLTALCGTKNDPCKAGWMGMTVTKPAVSTINGEPVLIIPTFMPDNSQPAGVVAIKVVEDKQGKPQLMWLWQYPELRSKKAAQTFRSHPSFPVISTIGKDRIPVVWVVDIGSPGVLYGIRVDNGEVLVEQPLLGAGRPLSAPVIDNDTIYLSSILPATNRAMIEAYRIQ